MYVNVKQLHYVLQNALKACGYAKKDVKINIKESESLFFGSGDGYRGFACLVNMSTGETKMIMGSWGGSNMFNPSNIVDNDTSMHMIPENGAVILGYTGGSSGVTHCSITIQPKNVIAGLLTSGGNEISAEEKDVLGIIKGYKPAYRKQYLAGKESLIESLVSRGMLARNKAGAISITTKGKNAVDF